MATSGLARRPVANIIELRYQRDALFLPETVPEYSGKQYYVVLTATVGHHTAAPPPKLGIVPGYLFKQSTSAEEYHSCEGL